MALGVSADPVHAQGSARAVCKLLDQLTLITLIFRLPGPVGEKGAGDQGVGVLGAKNPLADGQQGGEPGTSPGRIPALSGEASEFVAGAQGVGCSGPRARSKISKQGGQRLCEPLLSNI